MAKELITMRGNALRRLIAFVGAAAFVLQGYDQSVMNGLLTLSTFLETFPETDTTNTKGSQKSRNANVQGVTVAIYEIGCAFGALSCMGLGDRLGRRKTIFGAALVILMGSVIQGSSFSLPQLIVGRIVTGLGVGAFTATIPMYISETAHAQQRGRLVLLEGLFGKGGIVLASWINFGMYYVQNSSASWRFPIAFQLVFVIFVLSMILQLPESPRWLVKQDRLEEAGQVMSKLDDLAADSSEVTQELSIIRQSLVEVEGPETGISNSPFALTQNRHLHRTILAVLITMFSQMTGTNVITFYSNSIFQNTLGYSGTVARIFSGCIQIWSFVGAALGVILVDRVGRRKLLLGSTATLAVSQICLAGLSSDASDKSAASACVFFYFVALFGFPIGLFLIPFMYGAEIAPLRIRAKVTGIAAATSWCTNFLLAEVTPAGFANIGWRYYVVYGATSTVAFFIIYYFYPETKGRSLEEIDTIFIHSKSIFDTVRIARELPLQSGRVDAEKGEDDVEVSEHETVEHPRK